MNEVLARCSAFLAGRPLACPARARSMLQGAEYLIQGFEINGFAQMMIEAG
jgi:hypothetical protein